MTSLFHPQLEPFVIYFLISLEKLIFATSKAEKLNERDKKFFFMQIFSSFSFCDVKRCLKIIKISRWEIGLLFEKLVTNRREIVVRLRLITFAWKDNDDDDKSDDDTYSSAPLLPFPSLPAWNEIFSDKMKIFFIPKQFCLLEFCVKREWELVDDELRRK